MTRSSPQAAAVAAEHPAIGARRQPLSFRRVGAAAVRDALTELRATGDSRGLVDRMLGWQERQDLVGLPEIEALEARYRVD